MRPSSRSHDRTALAGACLASLMFGLEISSVPVILPTLEAVLRADFNDLQWVMNAYTIAVTTVLMATGALADRYGRKRLLILSIVAFAVASIACGLAETAPLLIAARALQGLSGGAMLIGQIAVLSHQFEDPAARGRAFAAWGIVFGFGLGFGPIIGGGIVAVSSWEWVFLVHAPIALLTLALVARGVRESRDPDARVLDLAGILTLSLSVFLLAYFITQGPALGFASTVALAAGAGAAASFLAFIAAERLSARPMVDFAVFRIRPFSGALFGSIGMNASFWPFMIYLPIYFQGALGYDAATAGLALLAYTVPTLLVPPLAERLSLRYRPSLVIPAGLFSIGLGFLLMKAGSSVAEPSWASVLPGALVAGAGLGLTNTPVTNTTTGSVPSTRAGMASGIDMSARMISLAVNIALMGFILVGGIWWSLRQSLPDAPEPSVLWQTAEKIAAGDRTAVDVLLPDAVPAQVTAAVQAALAQGFGWVMLYGGVAVWILAGLSRLVFGPAGPSPADATISSETCQSS